MSVESLSGPGFYGKLPILGDFITRRLLRPFIDPWDEWLQSAIACSREQLGDAWLDTYLTSPLWRFALAAGACGAAPCTGVMTPSVDRVGRYFPLVIAIDLPIDTNLIGLPLSAADWYVKAEELLLSVFEEEGLVLDAFDASVAALGAPGHAESKLASPLHASEQGAWYLPLAGTLSVDDLALLTQQLIAARFSSYSLWWTEGSERVSPCMLTCRGLPPIQGFSSMLGSSWEPRVWHSFAHAAGAGAQ